MSQRYWAFLSYSHADEAAAAKLHRALENYTLPASVRRAHGLPRRLVPVFRDVEELEASSGLTARLQGALDESRWLIVLCSPAAVQSKYVNAEIEYFIGKHSAGKILCVLLEGEPAESYPPAIRALPDEPLAADLRTGANLQLAVLKLIAAMATVGFTELRNREAQRRKRQRDLAAAAVAAITIGAIAVWDLYYRHHVEYYAGYVRRHGIWEGTDSLPESVAARRRYSFRFERHGRLHPPDSVFEVNGLGRCPTVYGWDNGGEFYDLLEELPFTNEVNSSGRYCSATFRYRPDGSIAEETLHNLVGAPAFGLVYTTPNLAQLTQQGFAVAAEGGGIRYVQIAEDERGYARDVRFFYAAGMPRANRQHAFGYRYGRDDAGRVVSQEILDGDGNGVDEVALTTYTGPGNCTIASMADREGHPLPLPGGFATFRRDCDAYGNVIGTRNLDDDGKAVADRWGMAASTNQYDEHGSLVLSCNFDDQGRKWRYPDASACQSVGNTPEGWITRVDHFDADGRPAHTVGGVISFRYYLDAAGNKIGNAYFDDKERPVESWRGNAGGKMEYDAAGRLTAEYYYGVDGQRVDTLAGAQRLYGYDSRGALTSIKVLDRLGKSMVAVGNLRVPGGFATQLIERDERGNITARRYLGADGLPILIPDGYAAVEATWDRAGNAVEHRLIGVDGRLHQGKDGYALWRSRFDRMGHEIEVRNFDSRQAPSRLAEGYFGYLAKWNASGLMTEKIFLDRDGKPMAIPRLGYSGIRYEHVGIDPKTITYLDAAGVPLTSGVVRERLKYSGSRLPLNHRYEGASGELVLSPVTGCAEERNEYEATYNLVLEQCFGVAGALVNRKDGGWARHVVIRENGRPVEEEWFDAAGKPVKPAGAKK